MNKNFEERFVESVMGYISEYEKDNINLSHDGLNYYITLYDYMVDVHPYTLRYEDTPKMKESFGEWGIVYEPFTSQFKFGKTEVERVSFQLSWSV